MRNKTETALLARGFDTELIKKIDQKRDTLRSLHAKSEAALLRDYSDAEILLIKENIKRKPIPPEVLERVISAADGACCFCDDGNSARPYQIHHIVEYAKTQDNSEDNLVLICPSHHLNIPKHFSAAEQKARRRSWQATVRIARAYRARGLEYPYGLFTAKDFGTDPRPEEVIQRYGVSPATALAVSRHELADEGVRRLRSDNFLLIVGAPGDGKTILAVGIGGLLAEQGLAFFSYQRPVSADSLPVKDIMTFLEAADRQCVLLLDDANLALTEAGLGEIARAAGKPVLVVATWTRESLSETVRLERHHTNPLLVSWERLQSSIRQFLIANEPVIVRALQPYDHACGLDRIGMGYLATQLTSRIVRYEKRAKTSAEFFFLLRGGANVVATEVESLAKESRADVPVLYAAVEQIAGFERFVTPLEAANACSQVEKAVAREATSAWVEQVFETQCKRGRMQRSRGAYTTIHRDWAKRLIEAGCSSEGARDEAEAFLRPNLDLQNGDPMRILRTWSWIWYENAAGRFARETLAQAASGAWTAFVGRAIVVGFEAVGPAADRMHLLFRRPGWEQTLAGAFEAHENELSLLLNRAMPDDVYALKSLSMALSHASPAFAARFWRSWPPISAAELIEKLHPDAYDATNWMLVGIMGHSPEWVKEVGRFVRWDDVSRQLEGARVGDIASVFKCKDLLSELGVPIRRSMIRRFATVMAKVLAGAHWADISVGLFFYSTYWVCFPIEVERIIGLLDPERLADELGRSRPREWRNALELAMFTGQVAKKFFADLLGRVDLATLTRSVHMQAEGCEYELRCLIWLLSRADEPRRTEFSKALNSEIRSACSRSLAERSPIVRAYRALDEAAASALASELAIDPERDRPEREEVLSAEIVRAIRDRIAVLDASGEDYVFDEWVEMAAAIPQQP